MAKRMERCSGGVEDQAAREALWGQYRTVSSVLEAFSRASGSAPTFTIHANRLPCGSGVICTGPKPHTWVTLTLE
jgi:hypothetical protein